MSRRSGEKAHLLAEVVLELFELVRGLVQRRQVLGPLALERLEKRHLRMG